MAFCDQINKELEGPQISVRLLAHKIQSPQAKESLYALAVRILKYCTLINNVYFICAYTYIYLFMFKIIDLYRVLIFDK